VKDPFAPYRVLTPARIGLGRVGDSPPTRSVLTFDLDHARARDAVRRPLDTAELERRLAPIHPCWVSSQVRSREEYLRRPDLGRALAPESRERLAALALPDGCDVTLILADGLSAAAAERCGPELVRALQRELSGLRVSNLIAARGARVALGDEIGEILGAEVVVILLGERPGLSVPESLGAYLTYHPRVGRTDAERNCVSNIHAQGLSLEAATHTLAWLIRAARERQLSGVQLKDDSAGTRGLASQQTSVGALGNAP
jgi:ethanolamine ammonia-lyase small subunit